MDGLEANDCEHRLKLLTKRIERLEEYSDRFSLVLAQLIVIDVSRGCGDELIEWAFRYVAEYEEKVRSIQGQ